MHDQSLEPRRQWVEESDIDAPPLIQVRRAWDGWRDDAAMPAWSIDRLLGIEPSLLPYTAVVGTSANAEAYRYVFWGTGLTTVFGKDFTREAPTLLHRYPKYDGRSTGYERVFQQARPLYLVTEFVGRTENIGRQLCVRLPFGQGDVVDHVISVALFSGANAGVHWNDQQVIDLLAERLN